MPRRCSICDHQQREAIEKAIAVGESLRHVAKRFGTSATAIFRHKIGNHPASRLNDSGAEETNHMRDSGDAGRALHSAAPAVTPASVRRVEQTEQIEPTYGSKPSAPHRCTVPLVRPRPQMQDDRIFPIDGSPPGRCKTCGCTRWRMRMDGSLICDVCRPLPRR